MDYAQIERFLTIVKHMNLGRAANELYISQSALSQSISKLETELGIKLFHRSNNKLILTNDANALIKSFEEIQTAYKHFQDKLEDLKEKEKNDYIIAGFAGSSSLFATLSITDFFNKYTGGIVTPLYTDRENLKKMLLSGQVDFGITYPPLSDAEITGTTLFKEATLVAVPSNHPYAGKGSLSLEDLSKLHFFGLAKGHHFRNNCDKICSACGVKITYDKTMLNRSDWAGLIEENRYNGNLVSFVAQESYRALYDDDGYIALPIDDPRFSVITTISWLNKGQAQYEHASFITYAVEHYARQRMIYEKLYHHLYQEQVFLDESNTDIRGDEHEKPINQQI